MRLAGGLYHSNLVSLYIRVHIIHVESVGAQRRKLGGHIHESRLRGNRTDFTTSW